MSPSLPDFIAMLAGRNAPHTHRNPDAPEHTEAQAA